MKKKIHPAVKECTIKCACGATFQTISNREEHQVEVCNECHPFYNANASVKHKKTGAVEKFNKKFNYNQD